MSILTWIDDNERLKLLNASKYIRPSTDSNKGLWTRCDKCGVILYIKHLIENQRVCFGCAYHLQMNSPERIKNLLDKDSWRPFDETVSPCDPLEFHDQKKYTDRLQAAQDKTGLQDAIQTGSGRIEGIPVALGVMDFDFMGGSMGSVVGEKITRLIEYATQEGLTLILICASGGARMQEGVFGLMQMAKISGALRIYQSCANLLYISILTSPTTGGVTASFGMLGDIIFAEPRALIAFAGRRVIEQTLCEDLPEDFQSSEYMLNHGLVDLIVPRRFLRQALSESIKFYKNAPFKKTGKIPFGVQNPINFVTEEKVRRQWNMLHLSDLKDQSDTRSEILSTNLNTSHSKLIDSEVAVATKLLDKRYSRNQSKYRTILTSFEKIFNLFSRQMVVPDIKSQTDLSAYAIDPSNLLESNSGKKYALLPKTSFLENEVLHTSFARNSASSDNTISPVKANPSSSLNQSEDIQKEPRSEYTLQEKSENKGLDVFTPSSSTLDNNKNIDFLNQAIELAATESVEWRAFYVSQRISKTMAEDFFQVFGDSEALQSNEVFGLTSPKDSFLQSFGLPDLNSEKNTQLKRISEMNTTTLHNTLFYRSICRSTTAGGGNPCQNQINPVEL
ncbi:acetyl-CoA carboxylase carboxyltransferase subunit beta [bacterium]|nr:MAG: acetyl-CoA carboxylase carboxyltransferase subunit beta [bacterium]